MASSEESGGLTQREVRIQAMKDYVEWLENHDLDENSIEAAKRLGCIKGDVQWLIQSISGGPDE